MKSQNQTIISWLKRGYTIDTYRAWTKFHCSRLASRIHDIKNMGYAVDSRKKKVKNRYGKDCMISVYWLR